MTNLEFIYIYIYAEVKDFGGRDGLSGSALDYRTKADPESRVRAQVLARPLGHCAGHTFPCSLVVAKKLVNATSLAP